MKPERRCLFVTCTTGHHAGGRGRARLTKDCGFSSAKGEKKPVPPGRALGDRREQKQAGSIQKIFIQSGFVHAQVIRSSACTVNMFKPFLSSRGSILCPRNYATDEARRKLLDNSTSARPDRRPSGVRRSWTGGTWTPSDLPQYLHDGDGGALAEDEGAADQREGPPKGEDDSGNTKRFTSGVRMTCRHGDRSWGRSHQVNQQSQHPSSEPGARVTEGDRTWAMLALRGPQVSVDTRYYNSRCRLARTGVASVHAAGVPSALERWRMIRFILPGPPGHWFRLHGKHQTESCSNATQRLSGAEWAERRRSQTLG